jgi:UDP-N-acetylglucosamine 2-epimerase (non-hydrolysing)
LKWIDVVAGARPNFMKVAPILRVLKDRGGALAARLVHTGQHYDPGMSDVFFQQLGIPKPDRCLNVGSGTHAAQTGRIMAAFEEHLLQAEPRSAGVVVVGDVNSTMAAALVAVKLGIPVAHVEAGLRSFDRTMPEEINRVVTDAVADLLLVSEPAGEENLRREGIPAGRIVYVGNVMIDSLVRELPEAKALRLPDSLKLEVEGYCLVTIHRPANVDEPDRLARTVELLEWVSERLPVVFPLHPRTKARLVETGLIDRLRARPALRCLEPVGYRESVALMAGSRFVLTDSGGIQEETSYLGVPCLTLRASTERPVTVDLGTNTVVGDEPANARALVEDILRRRYKKGGPIPGWDGAAAPRVVEALMSRLGDSETR